MRLNINLASRPYYDTRTFYLTWVPLLLILAIAAAFSSTYAYHRFTDSRSAQSQLNEKEQQIAQLDKEHADAETTLNLPQNSGTRDQSQFINERFARKAFSWTKVLSDLESVMPNGVQVVSIKPEITRDGQMRFTMTVAADHREDAIELQRRMEASPRFIDPQIVTEHTKRDTKDNRLSVEIVYVPRLAKGIS